MGMDFTYQELKSIVYHLNNVDDISAYNTYLYIYIYNLALYHSMKKYQYLIKYELIQIGKVKELSSNTIFFFLRL